MQEEVVKVLKRTLEGHDVSERLQMQCTISCRLSSTQHHIFSDREWGLKNGTLQLLSGR